MIMASSAGSSSSSIDITNNKRRKIDLDHDLSSAEVSAVDAVPPPLSAVAARKAAKEAQAAAAAAAFASTSNATASTSKAMIKDDDDDASSSDEDAELLDPVLSSADEDSDDRDETSAKRSARLIKDGKGAAANPRKKKQTIKERNKNAKQATRYFAGSAGGQEDQDEHELRRGTSTVAASTIDSREGTFVPFDPMDDFMDDSGPLAPANKARNGRGKRQRREKSAFVDPACSSAFIPEPNVNLHRIQLTPEQGQGETSDAILFCLRQEQMLVFHGALLITPIVGSLSILNATLTSPEPSAATLNLSSTIPNYKSYPVFAPSSHPIPPIHPRPLSRRESAPNSLLLPDGRSIDLTPFEAAVLVRDHNTGIEGIEPILKNGGLGCAAGLWEAEQAIGATCRTSECNGRTWKLVLEPTPSLTLLRAVEGWEPALAGFAHHVDPPPSINGAADASDDEFEVDDIAPTPTPRLSLLIEGPKRVGKSTFSKLLLNQLLSRYTAVAYLDTDLGQPEFTPSGVVSLNLISSPQLGPAFTHLSTPLAAHFLGTTSPANDPSAYLAAIKNLYETYETEVEYSLAEETRMSRRRAPHSKPSSANDDGKLRDRIPLIVNTHGWIKGLGLDLSTKLKVDVQPTHVFAFEPDDEASVTTMTREGPTLFRMTAAPPSPLESKWSSADLRILSLVSYFHAVFPSIPSPASFVSTWDFSLPLTRRTPYLLDWTTSISSVSILGAEIDYTQVLYALNGSLVAIVDPATSGLDMNELESRRQGFPYDPLAPPPPGRSLGLALIRSIDPATNSLHLLTPVARPVDGGKIALVKGSDLEIPVALLLDADGDEHGVAGVEWKDVPYLSVEGGEGGGRRRVRRNLMRRGQA